MGCFLEVSCSTPTVRLVGVRYDDKLKGNDQDWPGYGVRKHDAYMASKSWRLSHGHHDQIAASTEISTDEHDSCDATVVRCRGMSRIGPIMAPEA